MTSMYMYMLSCHACRFWWFPWGVSKNTVLGGVSKMVVFGGDPKKGHFWPPRGAQNFLHPPPGKPRQNIYYLDTRHPPGGGRFGGWFSDPPPGPSWPGCVLVPFLHPPAGVQKLGSWHHRCHDHQVDTPCVVKKFSCTHVMRVHHHDMKIFFVCWENISHTHLIVARDDSMSLWNIFSFTWKIYLWK